MTWLFVKALSLLLVFLTGLAASTDLRPLSTPFVSGDDFRAICKFIVDDDFYVASPNQYQWNKTYFNTQDVQDGDAIFVNLAYLEGFFRQYHPKIKARYILISHNHDFSAPGPYKKFLDDNQLFAWFTQNCDYHHPKIFPIPIGLPNKHWNFKADTIIQSLIPTQNNIQKKYLFYVNFNINTAPIIRRPIHEFFKKQSFSTCQQKLSYTQNYTNVALSKFVISPHGNGLDCHRTWEALYLCSFPIVKASTLDPLYSDLPVVLVNDWKEVTKEFLEQKYIELTSKTYDLKKLYFDYWLNLIRTYQSRAKINSHA